MFLSHFPGAPAVLGLGKGWAKIRWLCAVLDSLSRDPRTEWNHSLSPFSLVMPRKTIMDPNLWATWPIKVYADRQKVDVIRSNVFFLILLHPYSHTGRSEVRVTVCWQYFSCMKAAQLQYNNSVAFLSPRGFQENIYAIFAWIFPSCTMYHPNQCSFIQDAKQM